MVLGHGRRRVDLVIRLFAFLQISAWSCVRKEWRLGATPHSSSVSFDSIFRAADTDAGPVCTGAEYRVSYTQRVWVDVTACIYKPTHHRHLTLDLFLIDRLLGDAEYRYGMGHVEAQMYSVMSSVLDYTWLFKDAQSTV